MASGKNGSPKEDVGADPQKKIASLTMLIEYASAEAKYLGLWETGSLLDRAMENIGGAEPGAGKPGAKVTPIRAVRA